MAHYAPMLPFMVFQSGQRPVSSEKENFIPNATAKKIPSKPLTISNRYTKVYKYAYTQLDRKRKGRKPSS